MLLKTVGPSIFEDQMLKIFPVGGKPNCRCLVCMHSKEERTAQVQRSKYVTKEVTKSHCHSCTAVVNPIQSMVGVGLSIQQTNKLVITQPLVKFTTNNMIRIFHST